MRRDGRGPIYAAGSPVRPRALSPDKLAASALLGLAGGVAGIARGLLFGFQREIVGGFLGGLGLANSLLGQEGCFVGCLSRSLLGRLLCRRPGFGRQPGGLALRDASVASNLDRLPGRLPLAASWV